jgi:Glyoxalase-like domain
MAAQLPEGDEIFLDHIAHFVADIAAAGEALARCGFLTTPFTIQTAPPGPDGTMQPTGTGNICAMLRAGYVEILAKTSETPLSAELDAAIARWPGVHLAAFSVAEPQATYDRLVGAGMPMWPMVHMRRPVEMPGGRSEARFTILRPQPGAMAEGRMQLLTHHTEAEVWQPRFLDQPNGAGALLGLLIVSNDPEEAAGRFKRLLGVAPQRKARGIRLPMARGHIEITSPENAVPLFAAPPGLPWIAAYGLRVDDLERAAIFMRDAGVATTRAGDALIAAFPPALGIGFWVFVADAAALPWL